MAFPTRSALQRLGIVSGALVALAMAGDPTESARRAWRAGLMAVVTIGLMSCLIGAKDPAGAVNDLGHMVLGVLYAGAFLPHFIWLRVNPPRQRPFLGHVRPGGGDGGRFRRLLCGQTLRQAPAHAVREPEEDRSRAASARSPGTCWPACHRQARAAAQRSLARDPVVVARRRASSRSSATSANRCSNAPSARKIPAGCCPATGACWIAQTVSCFPSCWSTIT